MIELMDHPEIVQRINEIATDIAKHLTQDGVSIEGAEMQSSIYLRALDKALEEFGLS